MSFGWNTETWSLYRLGRVRRGRNNPLGQYGERSAEQCSQQKEVRYARRGIKPGSKLTLLKNPRESFDRYTC